MRADLISYGLYHSLLESHQQLSNLQTWSKLKLGVALQSSSIPEAALELIEHFKKIDEVHVLISAMQKQFQYSHSLQPLYDVLTYASVKVAASGTADVERVFSQLTIDPNVRDRVLFVPDTKISDFPKNFTQLESVVEKCSAYVFAVGRLGDQGLHRSLWTNVSENVTHLDCKTICEDEFEYMYLQRVPSYMLLPSIFRNEHEARSNPRLERMIKMQEQGWPRNHVIYYDINDDLLDLACQFQNLLYRLQMQHRSMIEGTRGEAWGSKELLKVFIGYSHLDNEWFERIRDHITSLSTHIQLSIWDGKIVDTEGARVEDDIKCTVRSSKIVIFLISVAFINNTLVRNVILNSVLQSSSGLKVIPVIIDDCLVANLPLIKKYPAINHCLRPLSKMSYREQQQVFDDVRCIVHRHKADPQLVENLIEPAEESLGSATSKVTDEAGSSHRRNVANKVDGKIRVFVSYSHKDKRHLRNDSLLGHLLPLEHQDELLAFWWDKKLDAGDFWNKEIQYQIEQCDIALVLVSHYFLTSSYITKVEVSNMIGRRKQEGMIIMPIILSPCDWESHGWLRETQFEPRDGKNIEEHYRNPGKRKALYVNLYKQLKAIGEDLRGKR